MMPKSFRCLDHNPPGWFIVLVLPPLLAAAIVLNLIGEILVRRRDFGTHQEPGKRTAVAGDKKPR